MEWELAKSSMREWIYLTIAVVGFLFHIVMSMLTLGTPWILHALLLLGLITGWMVQRTERRWALLLTGVGILLVGVLSAVLMHVAWLVLITAMLIGLVAGGGLYAVQERNRVASGEHLTPVTASRESRRQRGQFRICMPKHVRPYINPNGL